MSTAEATSVPVHTGAHRSDPPRVQAGRKMCLAAVCGGFYAQKEGHKNQVHGEKRWQGSLSPLDKYQGWSHGDNLEGR